MMDHFKVTNHGRLYTSRGKTHPNMMYSGGCIFVDHAMGFVHIEHMINFTATQTIQAKSRFEMKMLDMGVLVQSYQSDNGIFASSDTLYKSPSCSFTILNDFNIAHLEC